MTTLIPEIQQQQKIQSLIFRFIFRSAQKLKINFLGVCALTGKQQEKLIVAT
jgi:hypothetical protein